MTEININFHEKPKLASVERAQGVLMDWLLKNIDLQNVDISQDVEASMKSAIIEQPDLLPKLAMMEKNLGADQTIMLATGMTHAEVLGLREDIPYEEWRALLSKAEEVVGGSAADFFEKWNIDSGLNLESKPEETSLLSGTSESLPENSSGTSTGL